jgi:formylglycine-generating enzyme required for sulfatase activity
MKRVTKRLVDWRRSLNTASDYWWAASRHLVVGATLSVTLVLGGLAWLVGGPIGTLVYSAVNSMSTSDYAATAALIGGNDRIGMVSALTSGSGPDRRGLGGLDGESPRDMVAVEGASDRNSLENSDWADLGDSDGLIGPFGISLRKWTAWEKYPDARELLGLSTEEALPAGAKMALRLRDLPIALRWCPAGSFEWDATMSLAQSAMLNVAHETAATSVGGTRVPVILTRGFAIMETECFQGMWSEVTGEEGNWMPHRGAALPVHNVSHGDAMMFAGRVHSQLRQAKALPQGWKVRLPQEAEWEYAMRAGGNSAFGAGIDSRSILDHAWIAGNSGKQSHPVASRRPNAWGIHDGLGSVMEWCDDLYSPRFEAKATSNNVYDDHWKWVYRGGAWGLDARYSQLSNRHSGSDTVRGPMLGLRLVLVREHE